MLAVSFIKIFEMILLLKATIFLSFNGSFKLNVLVFVIFKLVNFIK